MDIASKVHSKNLYSMRTAVSDKHLGYVLFLKGRVAVSPNHYRDFLEEQIE